MNDEIERGRLAQQVLENPVYAEAMARIHDEVMTQWQNEKSSTEREWLWSLNQACLRLQKVLHSTMASGQFKARQVEQDRSKLERLGKTFLGR